MIIEGLGNVTFVNGLLRIQAVAVGSDGKITETGSLEIPGNKIGDIISALTAATKGISEKLESESDGSSSNKEEKKSSNSKKKK